MNESVNVLLYWMHVIRLNAPGRSAWQKKEKRRKKAHLFHILLQLSFALVVWLTTPVIKSIAFSFFKSSLEDSGQQSNK